MPSTSQRETAQKLLCSSSFRTKKSQYTSFWLTERDLVSKRLTSPSDPSERDKLSLLLQTKRTLPTSELLSREHPSTSCPFALRSLPQAEKPRNSAKKMLMKSLSSRFSSHSHQPSASEHWHMLTKIWTSRYGKTSRLRTTTSPKRMIEKLSRASLSSSLDLVSMMT
jgi:hypothetical protein